MTFTGYRCTGGYYPPQQPVLLWQHVLSLELHSTSPSLRSYYCGHRDRRTWIVLWKIPLPGAHLAILPSFLLSLTTAVNIPNNKRKQDKGIWSPAYCGAPQMQTLIHHLLTSLNKQRRLLFSLSYSYLCACYLLLGRIFIYVLEISKCSINTVIYNTTTHIQIYVVQFHWAEAKHQNTFQRTNAE